VSTILVHLCGTAGRDDLTDQERAAIVAAPRQTIDLTVVGPTEPRSILETSEIAIGELSRRTECNIETIRYYERIALLPSPAAKAAFVATTAKMLRGSISCAAPASSVLRLMRCAPSCGSRNRGRGRAR
jgi:hypothetical protein